MLYDAMPQILMVLKMDLQISSDAMDEYFRSLIESAAAYIGDEGIKLSYTVEDNELVEMYAAYLYRSRKEDKPMPRMLRWALNNKLMNQKGRGL